MENRATTVLLADDHTMFREGMAKLLTAYGGLEVVGETANDDGAVALARETKPDVVIMEARLPFDEAAGLLHGRPATGDGAGALARETKPDVVIMEARLPFEVAAGFLDEMRRVEPRPKVIIVTMFDDPAMMRGYLRPGGSGGVRQGGA